ncbi:hypothetical protein A5670_10630 [Mycolicibacterium fortuitum]|nr:hypothetical protein A5670_10630 [Mycolicibacterium fortuitum]
MTSVQVFAATGASERQNLHVRHRGAAGAIEPKKPAERARPSVAVATYHMGKFQIQWTVMRPW